MIEHFNKDRMGIDEFRLGYILSEILGLSLRASVIKFHHQLIVVPCMCYYSQKIGYLKISQLQAYYYVYHLKPIGQTAYERKIRFVSILEEKLSRSGKAILFCFCLYHVVFTNGLTHWFGAQTIYSLKLTDFNAIVFTIRLSL